MNRAAQHIRQMQAIRDHAMIAYAYRRSFPETQPYAYQYHERAVLAQRALDRFVTNPSHPD